MGTRGLSTPALPPQAGETGVLTEADPVVAAITDNRLAPIEPIRVPRKPVLSISFGGA